MLIKSKEKKLCGMPKAKSGTILRECFLYAAVNFCHNHPPSTPGDLHQTLAPTLELLHPNFCPGGFFGVGPKGQAFVYKRFLPFLEFS